MRSYPLAWHWTRWLRNGTCGIPIHPWYQDVHSNNKLFPVHDRRMVKTANDTENIRALVVLALPGSHHFLCEVLYPGDELCEEEHALDR